jgi:hypothetical protein
VHCPVTGVSIGDTVEQRKYSITSLLRHTLYLLLSEGYQLVYQTVIGFMLVVFILCLRPSRTVHSVEMKGIVELIVEHYGDGHLISYFRPRLWLSMCL